MIKFGLLAAALTLLATNAFAACGVTSLTFKDAAGATQVLCFGGASGQFLPLHAIIDGSGNVVGATANALDVNIKSGIGALATVAKQPALGTAGSASTDVISVQGIASMTKLLVTPDLPAGASTAAKQPTLGAAGTASSDVLTVQGIASMTKLLVTPDLPAGASTAVKQPALGTAGSASSDVISVQGVASMTKLLVTPDLPSGASTAAKQPALGTAGSASSDVITVQGAASMTPLKVDVLGAAGATMDAIVGAASSPTNMLAVGGVFNSSPLTLTTGQSSALQVDSTGVLKIDCFVNCGVAQASTTSGQVGSLVMGAAATAAPTTTAGSTYPLSLNTVGDLRVVNDGGCAGASVATTTSTPINSAGASTSLKLVTKAASKNVYICAINLVVSATGNVALVAGTKTTNECDTSTAGLAGGATAATGWNFAANGGLTLGNGVGLLMKTATQNVDVCLLFDTAEQVSGTVTWAQF